MLFPDVNRGNQNPGLVDERPIYRYMRLPAFLMLLNGEAFIPTLANLRKSDPLESRLPFLSFSRFSDYFSPMEDSEAKKWLLTKMPKGRADTARANEADRPRSANRFFVETWLDELANRRCIWCWYVNGEQSMAQWKVYGSYGVAIRSCPKKIRAALQNIPSSVETSAGFVHYVRALPMTVNSVLVDPHWIKRPYYFKERAYRHEEEVRFVMAVNPVLCDLRPGGIILELDPTELIQQVIISPEIYGSEAVSLKQMLELQFPALKQVEVIISPLLSPDLETEDFVMARLHRKMNRPFEDLDQDYDYEGKTIPLPDILFGEV
jgi:hypothetical protein